MRASNIGMITTSLQSCSLATTAPATPPPSPPPPPPPFLESSDGADELTVELNSEVWEQCLLLQSGTMCYGINWDEEDEDEDEDEDEEFTSSNDDDDELSTVSYASSTSDFVGAQVLVVAGCKSCYMYFMVPKHDEACPKCGGGLLHLGRGDCI